MQKLRIQNLAHFLLLFVCSCFLFFLQTTKSCDYQSAKDFFVQRYADSLSQVHNKTKIILKSMLKVFLKINKTIADYLDVIFLFRDMRIVYHKYTIRLRLF